MTAVLIVNEGVVDRQDSVVAPVVGAAGILILEIANIDQSLRVRDVDEETAADYGEAMKQGEVFPPVTVAFDPETNTYYLVDGFHRLKAHERNGMQGIEVNVLTMSRKDAIWFALGANKKNAHRFSNKDKRDAVGIALRERPNESSRAIAEHIGCSHQMVLDHKAILRCQPLTPESEEAESERVVGKDQKSYQAKKTKPSTPPSNQAEVSDLSQQEQYKQAQAAAKAGLTIDAAQAVSKDPKAREFMDKVVAGEYNGKKWKLDAAEVESILSGLDRLPELLNGLYELSVAQTDEARFTDLLDRSLKGSKTLTDTARALLGKLFPDPDASNDRLREEILSSLESAKRLQPLLQEITKRELANEPEPGEESKRLHELFALQDEVIQECPNADSLRQQFINGGTNTQRRRRHGYTR